MRLVLSLMAVTLLLAACQSSPAQKKAEADTKKRATLHYRIGIDALHKGLLPKAFDELMLADSIEPNNPATLDAIAYAWRVRGDLEESERYYKKAMRHKPSAAARNNYGSLLIEMGKYKEAIKQLELALADPRYSRQELAFTNLGDARQGLKDYEGAVNAYRKAQIIAPRWYYPKYREAMAFMNMKRPSYAQALLESILKAEPANQEVLQALLPLLEQKGDTASSRRYLQAFIQNTKQPLQKAWAQDELAKTN